MAQTLTLSDKSTRILITTVANAPVLAYTDASIHKVINAVDKLNSIRAMDRVEFSVLGGGYTNLISFYPADNVANAMLFRLSVSTPVLDKYQIEFSGSEWTEEAIAQAKKVKDQFLSLNAVNALTSSTVSSGPFTGFNSHPTLSSGLNAYWKHDETGVLATRMDSIGINHLSVLESSPGDVNGTAGFHNTATASNNSGKLFVNTTDFRLYVPITISSWIYVTSAVAGQQHFFSTSDISWRIYYDATAGKVYGQLVNGFTSTTTAGVAIATGVWYHLLVQMDPSTKIVSVSIDNAAFDSSAVLGAAIRLDDAQLVFDLCAVGGQIKMDETAMWNRLLTTQERTDLYNGGTGLFL